jgi:hypothetical protein
VLRYYGVNIHFSFSFISGSFDKKNNKLSERVQNSLENTVAKKSGERKIR